MINLPHITNFTILTQNLTQHKSVETNTPIAYSIDSKLTHVSLFVISLFILHDIVCDVTL